MASRAAKKQRTANPQPINQAKAATVMETHAAYMSGYKTGFEDGRMEGFKQASTYTVRSLFGAMVIAAHSLYGFGQERCIRLLNRVYEVTLETLTTDEMAQRAFDEVGVEIDWTEPVEVAQPKPKKQEVRRTTMKKMITDYPKNNFETVMNMVYDKDGWQYIRHGETGIPTTDFCLSLCMGYGCDDIPPSCIDTQEKKDELLCGCMDEGCPIATIYAALSGFGHVRHRLKMYEDANIVFVGVE